MKNRTRKYALVLHLSEDEKRILECKLKLSDMRSKSDFIRMLIVNVFVYTIDYQYLRKYNYQLSMIGRNINQIAHKVNTTGSVYKEDMDAIQLDFLGDMSSHFSYDVNLFYNRLTELICNNQSTDLNAAKYVNSGSLNIAGIEMELSYKIASFQSRFNATMQRALSAEQYYYSDHHIYSVPWCIANLACEQRLLKKNKHSLCLAGNLRYTSRTLNKANSRVKGSEDFYLPNRTLLDLRLKYDYNNTIQFSLDCDNVFNTIYEIGGTSYLPYRYLGRTLLGTVAFKL